MFVSLAVGRLGEAGADDAHVDPVRFPHVFVEHLCPLRTVVQPVAAWYVDQV